MTRGPQAFDWNDIPLLVALAQCGSMRTAGKQLGLSTSTISRRVTAAEKALNARLFVRTPNGYKPTDAGGRFLSSASAIEGRIHSLISETNEEAKSVAGQVRLTSVDVLLYDWLIPKLPKLQTMHPGLEVRAIAENKALSFTRSEADIAIRIARPSEDAAIVMRRIGSLGMAVYASSEHATFSRDQWPQLPWIAFDQDLENSDEMVWFAEHLADCQPTFRCSTMSGVIRACEAGLGLALLPCFAADRSKKLRLLSPKAEFHRDLYLLGHRQTRNIRRFRVVSDWIAGMAKQDHASLYGYD